MDNSVPTSPGSAGLQAVLWDMDGLMVDSEPLWTIAETELASSLGGSWDDEVKARVLGTRLDVAVPRMLAYFGAAVTPAQIAATHDWLLHRMVDLFTGELVLMPGVEQLMKALDVEDVPMALVSSSYRVLVDTVLAHDLGPFQTTLAGDEVVNGKPHPEPYITAAARLGVDPAGCVVLEDSPAGVASGEAAGCSVLAVPSVHGVRVEPGPRRGVVRSLEDASVDMLRALL